MIKKYEEIYFNERKKQDEDFISEVINYYKNSYIDNPYVDPDIYNRSNNCEFYKDITLFLNTIRKDNFEYKLDNPTDCIYDRKNKLMLRTDQFGFSFFKDKAKMVKYPYGKYYQMIAYEKDAIKEIGFLAECMNNTRTIGGTFIWPLEDNNGTFKSNYNLLRGIASYIEDRVDLTLYEVKKYYDNKDNIDNLIISKCLKKDKIDIWLDSFSTFENYTKSLCFEGSFTKDGNIIDILKSDIKNNQIIYLNETEVEELIKNNIKQIQNISSKSDLKRLLNNISELSIKRSEMIEKKILSGGI